MMTLSTRPKRLNSSSRSRSVVRMLKPKTPKTLDGLGACFAAYSVSEYQCPREEYGTYNGSMRWTSRWCRRATVVRSTAAPSRTARARTSSCRRQFPFAICRWRRGGRRFIVGFGVRVDRGSCSVTVLGHFAWIA